jgi:cell division protein FtsW (lipid II flippase)
MDEKTAKRDRFNWRFTFYAALGAMILFVAIMIYNNDVGEMLYIFVAAPAISFIFLVVATRKKQLPGLSVLSMLVAYWAISLGLFLSSRELHTTTLWLLWSKDYKAKVLAQPDQANGTLKHIEWDGRGFPGAGYTVVYLVFDPNDSLLTPARNNAPGKFSGIPCGVYRVRRLERYYYSALFYTDTDWEHCN